MSTKVFIWMVLALAAISGFGQTGVQRLSSQVNTPNDETAPFQYGGRIYFTSIYQQHIESGAVQRIFSTNGRECLQFNINPKNASANAADLTLSSDARRMFYTICEKDECTIWCRERNYEGDWAAAQKLPEFINRRGEKNKYPTVGFDQNLRRDVLYFSSDRPGGKGGMDIWASIITPDFETGGISFGAPFPLPFNSNRDEVTPFFHMASQTLFFSSNGLPGYGGQDIFSTVKNENGEWQVPENAGFILNSHLDDWHYSFHTNSQKGYFSSNRGPAGDFDLYEVVPVTEVRISAFDIHDGSPIQGLVAEVFDEELGYSEVFREQPFDRYLAVVLQPERKYRIALLAEGYSPQLLILETERQQVPKMISRKVQLFREDLFREANREVPGEIFPPKGQGPKDGKDLPVSQD